MYGQTFEPHDIAIVGLLIVLEGVLSIDNALVLGILAKRLPKRQQGRALTYGLVGAFVFRVIAIATASFLLSWTVAKLLGGLYLVYISVKHFFFENDKEQEHLEVGADGQPVVIDDATGKAAERGAGGGSGSRSLCRAHLRNAARGPEGWQGEVLADRAGDRTH
jgi:predicted tellurium resistance membrane protein TerC